MANGSGQFLSTVVSPAYFNFGQWNHILWSANLCGPAHEQLYVNGVSDSPSAFDPTDGLTNGAAFSTNAKSSSWTTSDATIALNTCPPDGGVNMSVTDTTLSPPRIVGHVSSCASGLLTLTSSALWASSTANDSLEFNAGINFSNMAGGFWLNLGSLGANNPFTDWADVALWTGTDLVCQHGPWSAGCSLGGTSISADDLALFGYSQSGQWLPKDLAAPNGAIATLGGGNKGLNGLVVYLTGDATTFPSNSLPAVSATPVSAQGFYGETVQSLTSSASLVTPSNLGGQPSHVPGIKWVCSTPLPNDSTFSLSTCGQDVAPGDTLIALYSGTWTYDPGSTPPPSCTQAPSGAGGAFLSWNGAGGAYTNVVTDYQLNCAYYYQATSGDISATSFGGGAVSIAPARQTLAVLLDYANARGIDGLPGGLTSFNSSSTAIAAPGLATTTSDTVVAVYTMFNNAAPNYICPSGWATRLPGEPLVCDRQYAAGTSAATMGNPTATMGTLPENGSGGLIALTPH